MYGLLQTTSGNENVVLHFLCRSTYKRRMVFSFPPVVSCHMRVLTGMCLAHACIISEFPRPQFLHYVWDSLYPSTGRSSRYLHR